MPQLDQQQRIGIVLQGRMSSHRLPGKVLMSMAGKTLLQRVVEGCRQVAGTQGLWVATSTHAADDAIAAHCAQMDVDCYRGSLEDVAARFLGVAATNELDAIVRISADSPLVHPSLIERLVRCYRQSENCDLATNVLRRTYPSGMSVEVIRVQTLARAHPRMNADEREHVTPYFYARQQAYRIISVERPEHLDDCKLSVDTPADLERITRLIGRLDRQPWEYSLEQLVELSRSAPASGASP